MRYLVKEGPKTDAADTWCLLIGMRTDVAPRGSLGLLIDCARVERNGSDWPDFKWRVRARVAAVSCCSSGVGIVQPKSFRSGWWCGGRKSGTCPTVVAATVITGETLG